MVLGRHGNELVLSREALGLTTKVIIDYLPKTGHLVVKQTGPFSTTRTT